MYVAIDPISGLTAGDLVRYQLIGKDKAGNTGTLPMEFTSTRSSDPPVASFYEFTVTSLLATRNSYSTTFDNAAGDFALIGFKVGSEEGFPTPALHSPHPYRNGLGALTEEGQTLLSFERNELAMLRYPLRVGSGENTLITFDEVVLVEPGDTGAQFGSDGFYDYVVVEGSFDGAYWFPLEDGYDSRTNYLWETHFNSSMSSGEYPNSVATGHVTLMKKRSVLVSTGVLGSNVGQPLLLRFRLYSDQLSNGWGWAIDNLYVQENAPVVLANEEPAGYGVHLYPNPAEDYVDLSMSLSQAQQVVLEVYSMSGSLVHREAIAVEGTQLAHRLRVDTFPSGNYVVKVRETKGSAFKRFTKL